MGSDAPPAYVLDTNSLVSAFLFPKSLPGEVLDYILRHGRLLMSIDTVAELADVLRRAKFDKYLARKRREELIASTVNESHFLAVDITIEACRDEKDNKFLELAVAGAAAAIVTGDDDLLVLDPFQGIPIVIPRQFLEGSGKPEN